MTPMNRRLALLLCAVLAAPAAAAPHAPADSTRTPPPTPRAWAFSAFFQYESLSAGRPAWQSRHAYARRRFARGALVVEALSARRFDARDEALAADGWLDLWAGGYANVRLQIAHAPRFLPAAEVYAEIYQGAGRWEFAGSFRRRAFAEESVRDYGLAAAYYVGNWYLRARAAWTPRRGRLGWTQTVSARRYGSSPETFIEVRAGQGRGVEVVDAGPVLVLTQTWFVAVRAQRFFGSTFGFSATAAYSDDDFFTRRTFALGLLARW